MAHIPGTEAASREDVRKFASVPSLILDSLGEGVYGLDLEGRTTFLNRAACEMTGWTPEEMVGKVQHDLVHHTHADGAPYERDDCPIYQTLIDGVPRDADGEVFWRRDGSYFPVAYRATAIEVDGRVTGAVVVFRDLTRQIGAIQALRRQEARHRALLDALPDAIVRVRLDGEVLELRLPPGHDENDDARGVVGQNLRVLVGEELALRALDCARKAVHSGTLQQFEYERPGADGMDIREARFVAVGADEVVAVVRDVTEARRSEGALRQSEQRFRAIFNSMYQFIGLLKPDGTLLEANETALNFAGITAEDVVDRPFWEAHWWQISEDAQQDLRRAVRKAADGEFVRYEVDVLGAEGRVATIDFSLKPVFDEAGEVVLLIPEGRDITEQKNSERALRHSQQLLAGITNTSRDGIMAFRAVRGPGNDVLDFECLFANPHSAVFTGKQTSELIGHRLLETLDGARAQDLFQDCASVTTGETEIHENEFYYERDGEEVYFQSTAVKLGDGCVVTIRDVTSDRLREEHLRSSQMQLVRAQEIARLGSWEWDPQTGELTWSDELYRIYGLQPGSEVSFERYLSMVVPEDRDRVTRNVREALEERRAFSFEERIRRMDGEERVLSSSGEVILDDGYVLVMGVCHDVTDIRRAEQQLRESEQRFRQLAEQMSDLVSVHDADGTYVYVSPSVERILGYHPPALIGRKPDELMHPDDVRRLTEAPREEPSPVPSDQVVRMKDSAGDWVWLEFLTNVIRNGDGDVTSYQSSARDVTERVEAQQAAARSAAILAQRNRELQDFAYVASHDLQEPLRKIRAFADLLNDDYAASLDADGRFYLERVQDSAGRMSTLISDLLAFSRVASRAKPYEQVSLDRVAEEVISDLEYLVRDVGGRVVVSSLPVVEADRTQMRQLIQNLVGNALKFRRDDTPPVVEVEGRIVRETLHPGADEQDVAELKVSDNGIGFDEKYLDRIFTPFQRLHTRSEYAGTGMGLAICRRIVERHGGVITARSRAGEGSSFIVRLPLKRS